MHAPSTVREIAQRLNALGLRVPLDAGPDVVLVPKPKADEIRAVGGELIARSKVAVSYSGDIGNIARKMDALARKTDPAGAPRLALAPTFGTDLDFRDGAGWRRRHIEEDAYRTRPFLDRLAVVFQEEGWHWRFVETAASPGHPDPLASDDEQDVSTCRLLLVPAATVAELSQLAFIRGGAPAAATPPAGAGASAPKLPQLRRPEDVVGPQHYLVGDGECVDAASDYIDFVADLARLTDGQLAPRRVDCVDRDGARQLTFNVGKRRYEARLEENWGWVDLAPLLACLNRALADIGAPGRLYEHKQPTDGQEIAVAYAAPEEARALQAEGCELELSSG
jgi:hypothetical protein